jgi:hypothetical protein
VKVVCLDPINELDHDIGRNETLYWAKFIMDCKRLADEYRLLFIASGHPAKDSYGRLGVGKLLRAIDMSGSANWGNKADHTLCLWLPDPESGRTLLHHEKSKDHDTMGKPMLYEMKHVPGINKFQVGDRGWNLWKSKGKNDE